MYDIYIATYALYIKDYKRHCGTHKKNQARPKKNNVQDSDSIWKSDPSQTLRRKGGRMHGLEKRK